MSADGLRTTAPASAASDASGHREDGSRRASTASRSRRVLRTSDPHHPFQPPAREDDLDLECRGPGCGLSLWNQRHRDGRFVVVAVPEWGPEVLWIKASHLRACGGKLTPLAHEIRNSLARRAVAA